MNPLTSSLYTHNSIMGTSYSEVRESVLLPVCGLKVGRVRRVVNSVVNTIPLTEYDVVKTLSFTFNL